MAESSFQTTLRAQRALQALLSSHLLSSHIQAYMAESSFKHLQRAYKLLSATSHHLFANRSLHGRKFLEGHISSHLSYLGKRYFI
jgi:hypothetical protein